MAERKGTKALEIWCKRLVKDCPTVQIENMTTSWRNGLAFCALVHYFKPELINLTELKPENIYSNNQLAFSIAEKHLGIPALLDPEDMVENEIPDRLSILTYLSQFYQRLGHTVKPQNNGMESPLKETPDESTNRVSNMSFMFGKSGLDKCTLCNQSVYLAQRMIVSHKLYHRQCFRCSKCSLQLSPNSRFEISQFDILCESCKNISKNDDQIGMLAFDESYSTNEEIEKSLSNNKFSKPLTVSEKIHLFEKSYSDEHKNTELLSNLSITDKTDNIDKIVDADKHETPECLELNEKIENIKSIEPPLHETIDIYKKEESVSKNVIYKSDVSKYNFLQTQLDVIEKSKVICNNNKVDDMENIYDSQVNVTDDTRVAESNGHSSPILPLNENNQILDTLSDNPLKVPPRRKKIISKINEPTEESKTYTKVVEYPEDLNPFSDDEEENTQPVQATRLSTNPFGSSDEDESETVNINSSFPIKKIVPAPNPFWSDGEEPSSDEETHKSVMHKKSPMTTSTPNLPFTTRRRKAKAPPPPVIRVFAENNDYDHQGRDDGTSLTSLSSHNSTLYSIDEKSLYSNKRLIHPPADDISMSSNSSQDMQSGCTSLEKDHNSSGQSSHLENYSRRVKGPAPGLPLPERREVRPLVSPTELQSQLELLETQQLGLERQGVLIEQMIRDKCESDEAASLCVPQEEVEDLVIQLCELVNEKNDLFRKQTELMYIRRQQRLEQEQADIEHEIRVLQSRPAVNRIDADKVREEHLVSRLVEVVRLRDEIVQQLDVERRRERQEDLAIQTTIANKRAQRNSDSNASSLKSVETLVAPKKSKVKDKVKKQFKKAKHTLHIKKREEREDKEHKEKSGSKDSKSKWF